MAISNTADNIRSIIAEEIWSQLRPGITDSIRSIIAEEIGSQLRPAIDAALNAWSADQRRELGSVPSEYCHHGCNANATISVSSSRGSTGGTTSSSGDLSQSSPLLAPAAVLPHASAVSVVGSAARALCTAEQPYACLLCCKPFETRKGARTHMGKSILVGHRCQLKDHADVLKILPHTQNSPDDWMSVVDMHLNLCSSAAVKFAVLQPMQGLH
jgi:hypothetical protein